ncbi:hypothetical protein EDI_310460 [Entamoeba dispar SAW760]|uniref:Uncharacterized protein n=1 Tax=Entamoeba dispar (strain ATCC PRA-260 / SAW760) TaxID=370354 RepID=B0ENV6_ENTDS|nr:uncharacterized protein EDI_310460 [Entamoeba dispar SAW760]EDR23795.1 hypothetical protein EDI_310460 [Entamoeba dispar SAW760]|eukprot:EDR23795.1 hypothetical protein EDI_310460 [Entamoeba dispar SAW760]
MNEESMISHILYRHEQFIRTHLKEYLKESDEEKQRKYQIAAASQGCLPLIMEFVETNSSLVNSELLGVAIYNQQINVVEFLLNKMNELKQVPLGLSFTSLFNIKHYPFSTILQEEKIPSLWIHQENNKNSISIEEKHSSNSINSNTSKIINDKNKINQEDITNFENKQKELLTNSKGIEQNNLLFIGGTIINTSSTSQEIYTSIPIPVQTKYIDITSSYRSKFTINIYIGSLEIKWVNNVLFTPTELHSLPIQSNIPQRFIFTRNHIQIQRIIIPYPPDTITITLSINLEPYSFIILSDNSIPPCIESNYLPFIDFDYPPLLAPFLPPPLPTHLSILVYSLALTPNEELVKCVINSMNSECLFQQTTYAKHHALRMAAFFHEPITFFALLPYAEELECSIFRSLVCTPFSKSHRKILLTLPIKEFPREIIGGIDDIVGFNNALEMYPFANHIIDYIKIIKTALTTKSFYVLEILRSKDIVGIDENFSKEILDSLLLSDSPAEEYIIKMIPTPLTYYSAYITKYTNPKMLKFILENGGRVEQLNGWNIESDKVAINFNTSIINRKINGNYPLHDAVKQKNTIFINWLLQHGCNATLLDEQGKRAIDYTSEGTVYYKLLINKCKQIKLDKPQTIFIEGKKEQMTITNKNVIIVSKTGKNTTNINVVGIKQFELKHSFNDVYSIPYNECIILRNNNHIYIINIDTKEEKEIEYNNSLLWNHPIAIQNDSIYVVLPSLKNKKYQTLWYSSLKTPSKIKPLCFNEYSIDYILSQKNCIFCINILEQGIKEKPCWITQHFKNQLNIIVIYLNKIHNILIQVCDEAQEWNQTTIQQISLNNFIIFCFVNEPSIKQPHFAIDLISKRLFALPLEFQSLPSSTIIHNNKAFSLFPSQLLIQNIEPILFHPIQRFISKLITFHPDITLTNGIDKLKCHSFILQIRIPSLFNHIKNNIIYINSTTDELLTLKLFLYTGDPCYPIQDLIVVDRLSLFYSIISKINFQFHSSIQIVLGFNSFIHDFSQISYNDLEVYITPNTNIHINSIWFSFVFPQINPKNYITDPFIIKIINHIYDLNDPIWLEYLCVY